MKTHSGAKKRFRVTGSGKIMHERQCSAIRVKKLLLVEQRANEQIRNALNSDGLVLCLVAAIAVGLREVQAK